MKELSDRISKELSGYLLKGIDNEEDKRLVSDNYPRRLQKLYGPVMIALKEEYTELSAFIMKNEAELFAQSPEDRVNSFMLEVLNEKLTYNRNRAFELAEYFLIHGQKRSDYKDMCEKLLSELNTIKQNLKSGQQRKMFDRFASEILLDLSYGGGDVTAVSLKLKESIVQC